MSAAWEYMYSTNRSVLDPTICLDLLIPRTTLLSTRGLRTGKGRGAFTEVSTAASTRMFPYSAS